MRILQLLNLITMCMGFVLCVGCFFAGQHAYGQAQFAYWAACLGGFIVLVSFFGWRGARQRSKKWLAVYFWVLFVLLIGEVTAAVVFVFKQDDVVQYIELHVQGRDAETQHHVTRLVNLVRENFRVAAGLVFALCLFETVCMVLASEEFKDIALASINRISMFLGGSIFFVGLGVWLSHRDIGGVWFADFSMVLGVLIFLISLFGFHGVRKESALLLALYSWVLGLLLIVQIISAVYIVTNRERVIQVAKDYVREHGVAEESEVDEIVSLLTRNMLVTAVVSFIVAYVQLLSLLMAIMMRADIVREHQGYELLRMHHQY